MTGPPAVGIVVPTVGRESLAALLDSLAGTAGTAGTTAATGPAGPLPDSVVLVDDRRSPAGPLPAAAPPSLADRTVVLPGRGAGPAAARNVGWRVLRTEWVAFLDDDVLLPPGWYAALLRDLAGCGPRTAASQGRITVPLPAYRRPTDWERNVAGLERAQWATADMAYRRAVLAEVGGFDERFPRAYREDADLGLRVTAAGYAIARGERTVVHPVRSASRWVSVGLQRGNADDVLMRALHGPGWRGRAGVPTGRRAWHLATTAAAVLALAGAVAGRRRTARLGAAGYLLGVADFAWRRIAPGPRTPAEVAVMLGTSAVLPPVAAWHSLRGLAGVRRQLSAPPAQP